jgi:hypothetical protein
MFLGVFGYKYLSELIVLNNGSIINVFFLVYASIGLIIGFLISFAAIKKFNKEKNICVVLKILN